MGCMLGLGIVRNNTPCYIQKKKEKKIRLYYVRLGNCLGCCGSAMKEGLMLNWLWEDSAAETCCWAAA